jgi:hypothetical protein
MQSAPAHSGRSEHGPITGQGWMRALLDKVWRKQAASEACAHGSAKISGKALGVQQKMGSKGFKNRSIEPRRGHNETHGGGLKYQSPIAKPTHHRN